MNTLFSNIGARLVAGLFLVSNLGGTAQASLLSPGATLSLQREHEPAGGHIVALTNFTFTAASFTGTLTSKVWADDESNPWGGLTFSYKLTTTGTGTESLGLFTLGGFADLLVDVSQAGEGAASRTVARSADGEKITFNFPNRNSEETSRSGTSSAWLIIQTDSHTWGLNQLVGMDSVDVRAATFTPIAVPEPTVGGLLGLSGLALWFASRRNR